MIVKWKCEYGECESVQGVKTLDEMRRRRLNSFRLRRRYTCFSSKRTPLFLFTVLFFVLYI